MAHPPPGGIDLIPKTPQNDKEQIRVLHAVAVQSPLHQLVEDGLRMDRDRVVLRVVQARVAPWDRAKMSSLQVGQRRERIGFAARLDLRDPAAVVPWRRTESDALQVRL